jgi:hypothetical protein
MPRPVYILCSESGSEDAQTRLLSHFNTIERIRIAPLPAEIVQPGKPIPIPSVALRATAVWMSNEEDSPEQEYEYQMAFYLPPDGEEQLVLEGRFFFDADKPLYRMVVLGMWPPFRAPGVLRIESRIRPVGGTEWLRQDYPISVVGSPAALPATETPSGPTNHVE